MATNKKTTGPKTSKTGKMVDSNQAAQPVSKAWAAMKANKGTGRIMDIKAVLK